ncbi:LbetaH domain-containing protein [Sphingobium mellinum]|uniref:putative colanic acid biosynthesis acetyltransferase n=1 Tax=Sphingobium mellinum TaxID=1387166 RepID=UPI0030ECC856
MAKVLRESMTPLDAPDRSRILRARDTTPLKGGPSFSLAHRLERLAWLICWTLLARWTPPMLSHWRIRLLKLFGAEVGEGAAIAASAVVWYPRNLRLGADATIGPGANCYSMAMISIGPRTIISQRAHLCAGSHDVADPDFQLIARPITIGADVWIAAEAFVGPGVQVGDGAVLGARACAFSALKPWTIYRGNPAAIVRSRVWRRRGEDLSAVMIPLRKN